MNNSEEIKNIVKEKYGAIAAKSDSKGCCGPADTSCCSPSAEALDYSIFSDNYTKLQGYVAEADLGLGCGVPTEFAGIKEGDTVIDLGSGAGNDVFIARALVGNSGKVIGVDMTEEMVIKANRNLFKLGYKNIEFKLGEIENLPIIDDTANVVISNCVLNLVPDKKKAFSEIYRTLKPGAHLCVSDIVLQGELPDNIRKAGEMYAGCVSGALQQDEYLNIIKETGFKNVEIKKSKTLDLPDNLLIKYLSEKDIAEYRSLGTGIFSITVVAYK